MAWEIKFDPVAKKELDKLDQSVARRILTFLSSRVASLENPHSIGEALHGPELGKYWKYRVGDYRIISEIRDQEIVIVIVRIGNRREVYR